MRKFVAVLALGWGLMLMPALARDLPADGMTLEQVAAWLKGHNVPADVTRDSVNGDSYILSEYRGIKFGVYLYNCLNGKCRSLQYSTGWGDAPIPLEKVNAWNRDHRFLRVYRNERNELFGEYDIGLTPGGSYEMLDGTLMRWYVLVDNFVPYFEL